MKKTDELDQLLRSDRNKILIFALCMGLVGFGFVAAVPACRGAGGTVAPPTSAQLVKGAGDFCKARAAYKLLAAAAGGKLDAVPGSPRALLEADEDKFCVSFATAIGNTAPGAASGITAAAPTDAGSRQ